MCNFPWTASGLDAASLARITHRFWNWLISSAWIRDWIRIGRVEPLPRLLNNRTIPECEITHLACGRSHRTNSATAFATRKVPIRISGRKEFRSKKDNWSWSWKMENSWRSSSSIRVFINLRNNTSKLLPGARNPPIIPLVISLSTLRSILLFFLRKEERRVALMRRRFSRRGSIYRPR